MVRYDFDVTTVAILIEQVVTELTDGGRCVKKHVRGALRPSAPKVSTSNVHAGDFEA